MQAKLIEPILTLIDKLLVVTKQQADLLQTEDIKNFLELVEERDILINSLLENLKDETIDKNKIAPVLQEILELDKKNMAKLSSLIKETKADLQNISSTKKALYAYIGKDTFERPEARFIDKEE